MIGRYAVYGAWSCALALQSLSWAVTPAVEAEPWHAGAVVDAALWAVTPAVEAEPWHTEAGVDGDFSVDT